MNHKASAVCANGHEIELGQCQVEVKKLFGGTKICNSKGYEELSSDEVKCMGCKTVFEFKTCPTCGVKVPVQNFKKKGIYANLG
jgi:rRNA maturation endonuclease Nob1